MRSRLGVELTLLATLTVIPAALPACNSGELKLAQGAASEVFQAVGKNTGEIKVAESEVSRIASKYRASEDELAAVAGQADNYRGWSDAQTSADRMAGIAEATNNEAVSAGVDVACDWMAGEITSQEEFRSSVAKATVGMAANNAAAFHSATVELANRLKKMEAEGTTKDKAAAAWFCYAYSIVPSQ